MLPDMSDVLTEWEQGVILKTVSFTSVDFEDTQTVTASPILSVVQQADKESLNLDSLDWSKKYFWFHSKVELSAGQYIEYKGEDFKLVQQGGDWEDYGYYEFVGEQTKLPLLVAT